MVTCHCLVYPVGKGREAMFPYTFCQWKLDEFWPSGANSSMTLNPWGGQLFSRRQLFYCSFHFADPVYSNQVLPWDHLYWTQEIWKIQPSMVQITKLVGWFAVYRLCCGTSIQWQIDPTDPLIIHSRWKFSGAESNFVMFFIFFYRYFLGCANFFFYGESITDYFNGNPDPQVDDASEVSVTLNVTYFQIYFSL